MKHFVRKPLGNRCIFVKMKQIERKSDDRPVRRDACRKIDKATYRIPTRSLDDNI